MKDYINISMNGFPESKVDPVIRALTLDKQIVEFTLSKERDNQASCEGKALKLPPELKEITDVMPLLEQLKQVSLHLDGETLSTQPLGSQPNAALSASGCAADGGACGAQGSCAADGCAARGGCGAQAGCGADGCAGYGVCAADGGCVTRACAADAGCGANVPCAVDGCAGHACGADLCPANVNIGPCAVDIPVCPIIL